MSINVFKAAGVNLAEQSGEREETPHAGDGRLDVMTCVFMDAQGTFSNGAHQSLRQFFAEKFRPYSQHPDAPNSPGLRGMYLVPGTVVGRPSWNGLARIAATYMGMFDRNALPDAYLEATVAQSDTVASDANSTATLNYDINVVVSVDHNELRSPELSGLVNKLVRIEGISQGNRADNKTILALSRSEIVVRHGPYTILRQQFLPIMVASLNAQLVISNNRTHIATRLAPSLPTYFNGTENARLQTETKVIRLTDCTVGDSFINRLGAPPP